MTLMLGELIVILTEPSNTQQKIILNYLNNIGVNRIEAVSTGTLALDSIQVRKPDLVISSLYLPDMSGTDLLETLRNDQQLQDLPFLLISSETRFRYLDPVRQAGTIAILPKPCSQEELKVALHTTLDHLYPEHIKERQPSGFGAGSDGHQQRGLPAIGRASESRRIGRLR